MSLVPAICTRCGAQIEVDSTHEAGVCKYCRTAFITEKVINNYSINSYGAVNIANAVINNGPSVINYVKRAIQFENEKDIVKAIEYYNKALDIDADCAEALEGIRRIKEKRVLAEVAELVKNQELRKAITRLQEEYDKGLDTPRILDEIKRIETDLLDSISYSTEAQYRFKKMQLSPTKGILKFDASKLKFISEKECIEIDVEDIVLFSPTEDMNYAGEAFGRAVPNCIMVEYKDKKTSKMQRIHFRVHEAPQVVKTLNNMLKKLHG